MKTRVWTGPMGLGIRFAARTTTSMRVSARAFVITLLFCTTVYSISYAAEADLDEKELRQLIIGNTVDGENLQGSPFKQFFRRDGA